MIETINNITDLTQEEIDRNFINVIQGGSADDILFYGQFVKNPNIPKLGLYAPQIILQKTGDIEQELYKKAKALMGLNPDVNIQDKGGVTPAMAALRRRKTGIALLFLKAKGANLSLVDQAGEGILTYAVQSRSTEAVKKILEMKVPLEGDRDHGPLYYAVQNEDADIVETLIKGMMAKGKSLEDIKETKDFKAAWKNAFASKNKEIQDMLNGHFPEENPEKSYTTDSKTLNKKMERLSEEKREFLKNILNFQNKSVEQVLSDALFDYLKRGTPKEVDFLLKIGANPKIRNRYGQTALTAAIESFDEVFDAHGDKIPLDPDCQYRKVMSLIKAGADVSQENLIVKIEPSAELSYRKDDTSLLRSLATNQLGITAALLKKGAALEKDRNGNGPLKYAATADSPNAIQMVLAAGADINEVGSQKKRAMYWAVDAQKPANIMALWEGGFKVDFESAEGREILKKAEEKGNKDVLTALKKEYVSVEEKQQLKAVSQKEHDLSEKLEALNDEEANRLIALSNKMIRDVVKKEKPLKKETSLLDISIRPNLESKTNPESVTPKKGLLNTVKGFLKKRKQEQQAKKEALEKRRDEFRARQIQKKNNRRSTSR